MLPQQVEIAEHDKQMRIEKELRRRHAQLCDEPSRLLTQVGDAMHGFAAPLEEWGFVLPSGNVTKQQRQAHEQEMLGRLDATWLGRDILETLKLMDARRKLGDGHSSPYRDCARARCDFVVELNAAMGRRATATAAPADGHGEAKADMPFQLPFPLPPYIFIVHTPSMKAKDRSFGVGYASDPALMRHMCTVAGPLSLDREALLGAAFDQLAAFQKQQPHRSLLVTFSAHPMRDVNTAHWEVHTLELDMDAFNSKRVAATKLHELRETARAEAEAARAKPGKSGKAGKKRSPGAAAHPDCEAEVARRGRLIDDGQLSFTPDDHQVMKGVSTLDTTGARRVESLHTARVDGDGRAVSAVFQTPTERELHAFRNATSAICLDPPPQASGAPTAAPAAATSAAALRARRASSISCAASCRTKRGSWKSKRPSRRRSTRRSARRSSTSTARS